VPEPRAAQTASGLLPRRRCANLDFCAAECVKRECAFTGLRDILQDSGWFSGWKGLA
jgi:hypothetical protein